jgi:hypothetical protein
MQSSNTETTGRLVVVAEAGSLWTSWVRACLRQPDDAATIAQHPEEQRSQFALRAIDRLARRVALGWIPRTAVLALDGNRAGGPLDDRVAIGRALLTSLKDREGGSLVLAGDRTFSPAARHGVFDLAQKLMAPLAGTPIDIRVQFTAEPIEGHARHSHPSFIRALSRSNDAHALGGSNLPGQHVARALAS